MSETTEALPLDLGVIAGMPDTVVGGEGVMVAAGDHDNIVLGRNASGMAGAHSTIQAGDWSRAVAGDYAVSVAQRNGHAITGMRGLSIAGRRGFAHAGDGGIAVAGFDDAVDAALRNLSAQRAALEEDGFAYEMDMESLLDDDEMEAILSINLAGAEGEAHVGSIGIAVVAQFGVAVGGALSVVRAGDYGHATAGNGGVVIAGKHGHLTLRDENGRFVSATIDNKKYHPDTPYCLVNGKLVVAKHIVM